MFHVASGLGSISVSGVLSRGVPAQRHDDFDPSQWNADCSGGNLLSRGPIWEMW